MECKPSSPSSQLRLHIAGNVIIAYPEKKVLGEGVWSRSRDILLVSLLLVFIAPIRVYGSTVTVKTEFDYPLMRQLLIRQLFKTPIQSLEILSDSTGCNELVLSNPRVSEEQPGIEIVAEASADLGVGVLGSCKKLLHWKGSAGFSGRAIVEPGGTSLRFEPIDSWLVAADGKRIASGKVWELTKAHMQAQFSRFRLDLKPSVDTLGRFLPEVLPHHSTEQMRTIIDSLQLSDVQFSATGLNVSLSFQVEELAKQSRPEIALSAEELQRWDARWQMMDALFTFAVKHYVSVTESEALHSMLLEVLLDSRYRLRDALTAPANRTDDPVRRWFLDSWQRLSPIIRKIGLENIGQEPLAWISLLTATDALYTLDRFGPAMGLEISAAGLRRLARLIEKDPRVDPLRYEQAIDPELRQLFQLPELPEVLESVDPSGYRFDPWPIGAAWAGTSTQPLDRWVPGKEQLGEYLPLVAKLLKTIAKETLNENKLEPPVDRLFRQLVVATAWQESCWRQYVIQKRKIEPLRSSTGDVGLMQINEKIWRGFYDIQKLRWDIAYNTRAGTEILLNYLVKYGLKQGEHKRSGGLDNLARASYSAYNGGPGQIARYRNPNAASIHKNVDAAFWAKYQQVKAGNELNVAQCLGLETVSAAKVLSTAETAKVVGGKAKQNAVARDVGEPWVLAQNENRFTLQLAVFSQRESARKFIARLSLTGPVSIYPVHKNGAILFAVLYGSYANRADADREKHRQEHLEPWVRQFGDIRKAGGS